MTKLATLEQDTEKAASVRVLGKRIKLAKDYDPAGKDADTIIRTAVPFEMKSLNDDERTIDFIGSTATRDRYGDSIEQTGWELGNFVKNPVIPWGHNYNEPPVAKAVEVGLRDGNLFFKGQFASAEEYEYADTIYKLYKGDLRAFSVGFIPLEWKLEKDYDDDGNLVDLWWVFTKCELLEVSCVTVPANPEALTLAFREGVVNTHDKSLMLKQVDKLKSLLTEEPESSINTGMNEETKSHIDDKFAELKGLIVEQKDAAADQDQPSGEEPGANPSGDTDGGTPDEVVDADAVAKALEDRITSTVNKALGKIE